MRDEAFGFALPERQLQTIRLTRRPSFFTRSRDINVRQVVPARLTYVQERHPLTQFTQLGLSAAILRALAAENYVTPTPIQAQAIPHIMAGRDLLGVAQTGTGKTAAFALPILHYLSHHAKRAAPRTCRALVLSPTRELASQIEASFQTYGRFLPLSSTVIFGGVPLGRQIRTCATGLDIVVATPGRLLDLVTQKALSLAEVEVFVLDEADQMLDMGFIHDIKRLVAHLPAKRRSLFFSATMPREIADLAGRLLTNPAHVAVTPVASTAERIEQKVIFCETRSKQRLLQHLLQDSTIARALVFTRTKHGADRVVKHLAAAGVPADAIHGNKSQNQRERALTAFREGRSRLLVATDIAARGIDVDGVTHVVNFDLPNVPESYVHRIGRTARAGSDGIAISFCDREERAYLRDIERLTKLRVDVVENPLGPEPAESEPRASEPARTPNRPPRSHGRPAGNGGKDGKPQRRPGGQPQANQHRRSPGANQGGQRGTAPRGAGR